MSKPIHVTDQDFERAVLKSDLPVIVDFWAPWCGPCRMVAPILEDLAEAYAGKVVVAKVNTDDDQEWALKYGVQGIPTLLYIAGGKVIDRQVGAAPKPRILAKVEALLKAARPVEA